MIHKPSAFGQFKYRQTLNRLQVSLISDYGPQEVSWLDQDLFQRLDEQTDLSVGDTEEMGREMDSRLSHSETLLTPAEQLPVKQTQYQYRRKSNEKR